MTQEELKEKIAAIDRLAATRKKAAYYEYVAANAKRKIGDVVSDNSDTIRVEKIAFNINGPGEVSIYYWGPALTKTGEPYKDGRKRAVFEWAIK